MEIPAVANHGLVDVVIVAKTLNIRYFSHTNLPSDVVTELPQYITMIDAKRVVSQIG